MEWKTRSWRLDDNVRGAMDVLIEQYGSANKALTALLTGQHEPPHVADEVVSGLKMRIEHLSSINPETRSTAMKAELAKYSDEPFLTLPQPAPGQTHWMVGNHRIDIPEDQRIPDGDALTRKVEADIAEAKGNFNREPTFGVPGNADHPHELQTVLDPQ